MFDELVESNNKWVGVWVFITPIVTSVLVLVFVVFIVFVIVFVVFVVFVVFFFDFGVLEDELVVDEFEQPSRVEWSTTYVYEVLDVVSGYSSAMHVSQPVSRSTYSSVSGLGVTVLRPLTSRTVIA